MTSRIILLNGPSSSGKSNPVLDEVESQRCCDVRGGVATGWWGSDGHRERRDHSEPWRLADLRDVLGDHDITMVDFRCSPEELDRKQRGDRPVGLAALQTHGDIDIVERLGKLKGPKAFERLRQSCW